MERGELPKLIAKAQLGDQEAIEELLRAAHTPVSYQCRKLLKDPRDAEDMTQEVLLTVYTRLNLLKNPEAFWGWLNSITISRCMNALKRNHVDLQFLEDGDGHSVLDDLEELDEQQVPDKALDNTETARMIEEIVNSLPEAQRICTLMYYYDEMSVKEIAEVAGVPENTVKSRLNYARKAIKEQVLDYEKKGIKLYGLSPLPFLLYFLGRAAKEGADHAQAAAAAKQVMELGASAAAGGAAAAGTAAVSGTSSAAGAAAAGETAFAAGTAAAAGTSAAGGAAATAGTAAFHFLGGLSIKAVAGILAAILTVGGIAGAVVLANQDEPEPVAPVEAVPSEPIRDQPIETDANEGSLIPEDPGPLDSPYDTVTVYDPDTMISRTTMNTGLDNLEIYYEIPIFPETTEGYRVINAYFRDMRDEFFRGESNVGNVARALDYASASTMSDLFVDTYGCSIETYNDEITSVRLQGDWYMGGIHDCDSPAYTFQSDTGEQLSVLDVLGCTAYELTEMLTEALDREGILKYVGLDGNSYVDLSRDPAEYFFYISDGAVFVGVENVPMWRGEYYVKLDAPLRMGGSAPSAPPSGSPSDLLGSIAYYGDPAQCRMTADQARAFAEVIESETARLETLYALDGSAQSIGEITAYAALIDAGDGNPFLVYIGGLQAAEVTWDGSAYDIFRHIKTNGIWQFINGTAVPFATTNGFNTVYWTGSQLMTKSGFMNTFYMNAYEAVNGVLSETPVSTATLGVAPASSIPCQIDGQPATESEVRSWMDSWNGPGSISIGEVVGGATKGMTPAADIVTVLKSYAGS